MNTKNCFLRRMNLGLVFAGLFALALMAPDANGAEKAITALVIDGQNNHTAWPKTTPILIDLLEESGLFEVTHSQTPPDDGSKPNYAAAQPTVADMPPDLQQAWAKWRPDFSRYDVVVSNYNGVLWPDEVRKAFEDYMRNGGGLVVIHAADNAFAQWDEYNKMIGVGGWYGRTEKDGPALYWEDGTLKYDTSPGKAGAHAKRAPVLVNNRLPEHPIMKGMPAQWLHPEDEVYYNMRGPAEHITVLVTAHSNAEMGGSGKEHPVIMTLTYGKGRVFHHMLGHDEKGFLGAGFQYTLLRGTEWAATGKVTDVPVDEGAITAAMASTEALETRALKGDVLFEDDFNRAAVGSVWRTNDAVKGVSGQSRIVDGALEVEKSPKSDHGAVIDTKVEFTDVVIGFDFQISAKRGFNLVLDDNQCKTSNAGHICRVTVLPNRITLQDDVTGVMDSAFREKREAGKLTAEEQAAFLKGKSLGVKASLKAGDWYHMTTEIMGDTMRVYLDGILIGKLQSAGIGHSPKRDFGFTVHQTPVKFDNVKAWAVAAE